MKIIASNKKAYYEYFIEDTFEAGIVLNGCEVKSLRKKEVSLSDSFVFIRGGEVFLKNFYIKPYEQATSYMPDSKRDRKLLLSRKEILKLIRLTQEKQFTIIPTKIYFKGSLVKVEIASAKGKKNYDKRETIKERELNRELSRLTKITNN